MNMQIVGIMNMEIGGIIMVKSHEHHGISDQW